MKLLLDYIKTNKWVIVSLFFIITAFIFIGYFDNLKDIEKVKNQISEKKALGKKLSLNNYIEYYRWFGTLLCIIVSFLLSFTAKFWFSLKNYRSSKTIFKEQKLKKSYYLLAFFIIITNAFIVSKRLTTSYWTDENWTITRYTWGSYNEIEDGGKLEFKPAEFKDTLFNNKVSNNHILMSIFQKLCYKTYLYFNPDFYSYPPEWLSRLPAFVFGIFTLFFIAYFFNKIGYNYTGIALIALFSMHPWFITYMTYARGYSMVSFFTITSLFFLLKAISDSKWLSWVCFSLSVALGLYTFMGFVHFAIMLNLSFLIYLFFVKESIKYKIINLKRWLVTNISSACLFIFMALPALKQLKFHLSNSGQFKYPMTINEYLRIWSMNLTGIKFKKSMFGNPLETSLSDYPFGYVFFIVVNILLIISIIHIIKKYKHLSIIFIMFFLGFVPMFFVAKKMGVSIVVNAYVYPVFILSYIFILIFISDTLTFVVRKFKFLKKIFFKPIISFLLILALFLFFYKKNIILLRNSTENFRAAVENTRWQEEDILYREKSDVITISLWKEWQIYDPRIKTKVQTLDKLNFYINKAKEENKKLFVVVGNMTMAKVVNKEIIELLNNSKVFKSLPVIWGSKNFFTLYPYKLL